MQQVQRHREADVSWMRDLAKRAGLASRAQKITMPDLTEHDQKLVELEQVLTRQMEVSESIQNLTSEQRQKAAEALRTIRGVLAKMRTA